MKLQPLEQRVLMQAFDWESCTKPIWYNQVAHEIPILHQAGFGGIWLPPASKAADKQGYIPTEWNNLNSAYGSEKALKALITIAHLYDIMVLADMVLNHRAGKWSYSDFENPTMGSDAVTCDDEHPGTGKPDTGEGTPIGRDLDHTNPVLRRAIIDWLLWLRNPIGFDGWRYDFVRGFAGKYIAEYNAATKPVFAVGEYWEDFDRENPNAHRKHLCDWLDSHKGSAMAFDFTTKALLNEVVRNGSYQRLVDREGKPSGLIGWWPEKAVTFVDNHDTSADRKDAVRKYGQGLWPFPPEERMQGYAYILLHPGIPCVYWFDYFQVSGLRAKIDALIWIRKSCALRNNSQVQVIDAANTHYAAIVGERVCLKIGRDDWSPSLAWPCMIKEPNYRVWVRP